MFLRILVMLLERVQGTSLPIFFAPLHPALARGGGKRPVAGQARIKSSLRLNRLASLLLGLDGRADEPGRRAKGEAPDHCCDAPGGTHRRPTIRSARLGATTGATTAPRPIIATPPRIQGR